MVVYDTVLPSAVVVCCVMDELATAVLIVECIIILNQNLLLCVY